MDQTTELADAHPEPGEQVPDAHRTRRRVLRAVLWTVLGVFGFIFAFVFGYYVHLSRQIDRKLKAGPFSSSFRIYAAAGRHRDPQLMTALSDKNREKRRFVKFGDIPPSLVHALVSAEDKRFFQHRGFDPLRIAKAAWIDFRSGRKEQGASTLSMQLARNLWLEPDKNWHRKLAEMLITMRLEERLSKEQIFEDYANQVYLGRYGTYSINGFGEGARAFFGKDIHDLTLAESATLAGMVQRPSYFNPFRSPERTIERRNLVLALMKQNRYITEDEFAAARRSPLKLSSRGIDTADAPYFIDLVNDTLQNQLGDLQSAGGNVYTTIDLDLQRAAGEAVQIGMRSVDELLARKSRHKAAPAVLPQVALVALDPHTGEVKALVGGRDYAASQLNRALAERQPGSVFKTFVYAAALDTAVNGATHVFTPATTVEDAPTTFAFDNQVYQPGNFKNEYMGTVTLRTALAHSLNNATIQLAQMAGFDAVVNMARRAGLQNEKPTPAVALGAHDETPLKIAGAYTIFANQGNYVAPFVISTVNGRDGSLLYSNSPERRAVLDPRVAYLMVSMLQEVMRSGTAAGVRARGFKVPAAGKTGTSRDGWFAGFTSDLLCVVWVGFDDGRELGLEGAHSALPIWTEFMKRSLQYYRNPKPFAEPSGVVHANICAGTSELATPDCPSAVSEVFIDGTQPTINYVPPVPPDITQAAGAGNPDAIMNAQPLPRN